MKIPQYVMEHFRYKTETMESLKEDIRSGKFSEDDIWYANVISAVMEVENWEYLGFKEEQYYELIEHFKQWSLDDRLAISKEKYNGFISEKEKAIEVLLDYYNSIYNRFLKRLKSLNYKKCY